MQTHERTLPAPSHSYFWPIIWALALHTLLFGMLFVSFAFAPDLPPAKPVVQATLYQLTSKSPATVQTNQKIAGEAQKTAARQYEVEQLEQKKIMQQQAAAKAEEQKRAEQKKAEQGKAEQAKAESAKKAEAKKQEQAKKNAEQAKIKAAEDAKKKAEAAKKAEQAKKQAEAKKQEQEKRKADDKKKAEAARQANEDRKAQALAELLADDTQRQAAIADEIGDQVTGNLDDLIRLRAAEGWTRPPSARNGMAVQVRVNMLPDGTITAVAVARSSGDASFDSSAIAAVRNIGRIVEMQQLKSHEFNRYRSFIMTFTPEDLAL